MPMATLRKTLNGVVYRFRGLVHYYHGGACQHEGGCSAGAESPVFDRQVTGNDLRH